MSKFMRLNHRSFAITWLPVIGFWGLLIAIAANLQTSESSWPVVTVLVYFVVSAIFAYQLQSEFTSSSNDKIIVVTRANTLITCLFFSSLIALIGLIAESADNIWPSVLLIIPLIISTVIDGLASYSNEQLTEGFDKRSEARRSSISSRDSWKTYLRETMKRFPDSPELVNEIKRIQNIVEYSSFFRSSSSNELLLTLNSCTAPDEISEILREVH